MDIHSSLGDRKNLISWKRRELGLGFNSAWIEEQELMIPEEPLDCSFAGARQQPEP
jgi:hypothetical protein